MYVVALAELRLQARRLARCDNPASAEIMAVQEGLQQFGQNFPTNNHELRTLLGELADDAFDALCVAETHMLFAGGRPEEAVANLNKYLLVVPSSNARPELEIMLKYRAVHEDYAEKRDLLEWVSRERHRWAESKEKVPGSDLLAIEAIYVEKLWDALEAGEDDARSEICLQTLMDRQEAMKRAEYPGWYEDEQ